MSYVPLQTRKVQQVARRYTGFIVFMILLVCILGAVLYFNISPLLAGVIVFAVALWFIIGEYLPRKLEPVRPFYYVLGLGIALIIWGLATKGYIPLMVYYETSSYLEWLVMTFAQALIVASILAGAIVLSVLFLSNKLKLPKK